MTPLLPKPDHYLHNLITMTSPEAKKLWRRAIKEHFNCTCVYCGNNYEIHELTLDHVKAKTNGGESLTSCLLYTSPSPRDRTRSRMPSSA